MTNEEIINKINQWQNTGFVHQLVCPNHETADHNLVPKELDGKVVLVCSDCDYIKASIPDVVLSDHIDRMKAILGVWGKLGYSSRKE